MFNAYRITFSKAGSTNYVDGLIEPGTLLKKISNIG